MNIIDRMLSEKIVENSFHAAGMLNKLECVKLDTDEQRLDRCRLYLAWQKYFKAAKTFTSIAAAKRQAAVNAIAGEAVPAAPMFEEVHP